MSAICPTPNKSSLIYCCCYGSILWPHSLVVLSPGYLDNPLGKNINVHRAHFRLISSECVEVGVSLAAFLAASTLIWSQG